MNTFLDALVFNWLIAGTDAHAKNYSLLLGASGQVRLAPLYDMASALPYRQLARHKLKLAMKLGGTYRVHDVGLRDFRKLAAATDVDEVGLVDRARAMAKALPDALTTLRREAKIAGLTHAFVDRLTQAVIAHPKRCARTLS